MSKKKFFNIEHGHILYTKNKWKTFSVGNNQNDIDETYSLEQDSSIKQKVNIRHSYGEQAASLIIDEFNKIDSTFYAINNCHLNPSDGYGDHFEIFAASVLFNVSYECVIRDYLVIGNYDGGVDVIYYNNSNVYIVQIKMKQLENDNAVELMAVAIDEYEKTHTIIDETKKHLRVFLDRHYDRDIRGKNLHYMTISKNSCRKENKTPENIYNDFIGKTIERSKLFFKNNIELIKNNNKESVVHKPDDLHKEIFLFVNADELIDTLSKHIESEDNIDYLFVDNVRGRLKRNSTIIQTIKTEPEMFSFYNNGISIVGTFETQEESSIIIVSNPIIINGQQTVMSLFAAKKDEDDLSKVFVPVFLKSVSTEEELRKIAKYNNSQTKISSLDLLSIDANLRQIQSDLLANFINDRAKGKDCFYLDIVRNGKNKHKDKARQLFDKNHIIPVGDFVKLYSSIKTKDNLGSWKNALDANINKYYKNGFDYVAIDKAWQICNTIFKSKLLIGKNNDYKVADLIIQFLLFFGYSDEQIRLIIDSINNDSDSNNIAKASVYKKTDIINIIRTKVIDLSIDNKFDLD